MTYLRGEGGRIVKSCLNEGLLKRIAFITGGHFLKGPEVLGGLRALAEEIFSLTKRPDGGERNPTRAVKEWFAIPLLIALLLLCFEPVMAFFQPWGKRKIEGLPRRMRNGIFLFAFVFLISCQYEEMKKAERLYRDQHNEEALKIYDSLLARSPNSALLHYNAGVICFAKGDLERAVEHFTQSLLTEDPHLEARANYSIANCLCLQAEEMKPKGSFVVERYREALDYYERALFLDPNDEDAKQNRGLVERKLQEGLIQSKKTPEEAPPPPFPSLSPREPSSEKDRIKKERAMKALDARIVSLKETAKQNVRGMSRQEAEILLEQFRREEEMGIWPRWRKRMGDERPVARDW